MRITKRGYGWMGVVALTALGASGCEAPSAVTDKLHACAIDEGPRGSYCGELRVFENREARSGREIALKIVVARALRRVPKPDPLFVLLGGPGGGAATTAASLLPMFQFYQTDRDIVFVDQRGTGASNPLDCEPAAPTLRAMVEYPIERLQRCLEDLDADPRFYTTSPAMDDVDDVRGYLGYGEINLWGGSYGTRAALVYLARHEASVRSLVLDSAAPPAATFALYLAADGQRALDRLVADCAADRSCSSSFPDLAATVAAALDKAGEQPTVHLAHPLTGAPIEATISRQLVAGTILGALYSATLASLLPQLLHEAAQGDFQGLLGLRLQEGPPPKGTGEGAFLSVYCSEDLSRFTRDDAVRESSGTFLGMTAFDTVLKPCEFWPRGSVAPEFYEPFMSAKPALVLSGAEDPVAPPVRGEAITRAMPNARQITVPATGHMTSSAGCVPQLIDEFLDSTDARALDATCLDALRRPSFFVNTARLAR